MENNFIVLIPARFQSSRFPGKPLALIKNKPMIQWVYENVSKVPIIKEIFVATDDERILNTVLSFGGKAVMTSAKHTCGSDRLSECAELLNLQDEDIILNVQGDEPLIRPEMVEDLIQVFSDQDVYMGTLKKRITDTDDIKNPNVVKVVTDQNQNALLFSRCPLPYYRSSVDTEIYYKHIGIYGYKKWFLTKYSKMKKTPLECAESLEQLRVLENGFKIKVLETKWQTIGVDTPEQLLEVENFLDKSNI